MDGYTLRLTSSSARVNRKFTALITAMMMKMMRTSRILKMVHYPYLHKILAHPSCQLLRIKWENMSLTLMTLKNKLIFKR